MIARQSISVTGPEHSTDPAAQRVHETHCVNIGHWWRTHNSNWIAPAIAALIDPQRDTRIIHINDICQTIAINIPDQDPFRIIAVRKLRAVLHVDSLPPTAVAEMGPIADAAVVNESDSL